MKTQNGIRILGMSLVASMLLGSSAYAAQIVGADAADTYIPDAPAVQFSFGGLNLENVHVNMVTGEGNVPIVGTFDPESGTYPQMALGDSYESSVFSTDDNKSDETTRLGYLVQKVWPISEPTGIKVINNDTATVNGKPQNCIMGSSYQRYQDMDDENSGSGFLDTDLLPKPVICSSDAGTSKRIQLILNQNVVVDTNPGDYGQYVDLVFNIDPATAAGDHRYQVFQKVSNFTGKRLDGFTLEVLNSAGIPDTNLTLSLGIGEETNSTGDLTGGDLFLAYEMAFYPPGLWGDGSKKHLPIGWFDSAPSGYYVGLNENNDTMTSGEQFGGNYVPLFGNWQPDKWVGLGMHVVIDPLEEPELIAYWGNHPNRPDEAPAWYYGMDHNLTDGVDTNFTTPSQDTIDEWDANVDDLFVIDDIEDLPNVSLNYIVNVGEGIDNNFTIRVTPKVSVDQTPPSYISKDDNVSYILPPQLENNNTTDFLPAVIMYLLN